MKPLTANRRRAKLNVKIENKMSKSGSKRQNREEIVKIRVLLCAHVVIGKKIKLF